MPKKSRHFQGIEVFRQRALRRFLLSVVLSIFLFFWFGRPNYHLSPLRRERKTVRCRCTTSSNVEDGEFVDQASFDVCSIACTSGHRLSSKPSEVDTIGTGYDVMARSNAEVCILCRDAVGLLPNLTRRMRAMASKFKTTHLTVIENDSKDDTVAEFRRWAKNERDFGTNALSIEIEHHNLLLERPPVVDAGYDDMEYASQRSARYHRLSLLRNRCLLQLMKRPHVDFFIVLDVDKDVDDEAGDVDGIAHSFGLGQSKSVASWDVVCANSVLEEPSGVVASLYRNVSEPVPPYAKRWVFRDSLAFRDDVFDLETFRFHEKRIHTPYDEPYFVESCFGGLAIYKLRGHEHDWQQCSYEAFEDDDCEHISFHKCLRRLNWRVLFNPRMTVRYH